MCCSGVRNSHTKESSTVGLTNKERETTGKFTDSLTLSERGAIQDSKLVPCQELQKITYESLFYHIPKRRKNQERERERERERDGWQRHGQGCGANSQLKIAAMRQINSRIPNPKRKLVQQQSQTRSLTDFQSQSAEGIGVPNSNSVFSDSALAQGGKKNIVQYLGIAADEPERIKRHSVPGKVLPLVDIGWNEAYCREWCEENDLLSPIYTDSARGGCWFCHNQGVDQLRLLRKNYPDLWEILLKWDLDSPTTFKSDGHTVHDFEKRFQAEDDGKVPSDRKFRWKMIFPEKKED